jgi:hypothetical protein
MLKKDSILTGILAALVFPAVAFVAGNLLKHNVDIINRPSLPYLIAIALNLIFLRVILKKGLDQTGRGIMLATFVCMLVIFILKIHPVK